MALGTKIVIDRGSDGGAKRYRSTNEQIRQNEQEKIIQRERDKQAQDQVSSNTGRTPTQHQGDN